jgi:hypothetical protein
MPNPSNTGAAATPAQSHPPGGTSRQTRQSSAAAAASKAATQSSQPAAATGKGVYSQAGAADVASKAQPGKCPTSTPSPLKSIATMLEQIIQSHELEDVVKRKIEGAVEYAITESEAISKWIKELREQALVSTIREMNRQEFENLGNCITKQLDDLLETSNEIQAKVGKVTDAANKIASKTESYRDAILASPRQYSVATADLRVLIRMDRKAKQILVDIYDTGPGNILRLSLAGIAGRANEVVSALKDAGKPKDAKILTAMKTRRNAVVLTVNSKETAEWLKDPDVEMAFTDAFSKDSHIRERTYELVVPRVPLTFDPKEDEHLREVEEANRLNTKEIRRAKWIKPIDRQRPDQTHAYAIFSIASAASANTLIRDGLNICGTKVRPTKLKQEPVQCMKCRK